MTPTTDLAKRVAALCKRRETTPWSEREICVYRRLVKSKFFDNLDDLALIEQYYAFERKKGDKGLYRRDLSTFLNNAAGELDRATHWREMHPLKPAPRKVIPMPPAPSDEPFILSAEDRVRADNFMAQYQSHKERSTFSKVKEEMGK